MADRGGRNDGAIALSQKVPPLLDKGTACHFFNTQLTVPGLKPPYSSDLLSDISKT
jgi:hypothetical protein